MVLKAIPWSIRIDRRNQTVDKRKGNRPDVSCRLAGANRVDPSYREDLFDRRQRLDFFFFFREAAIIDEVTLRYSDQSSFL